ncbi:MAG: hypothetical protein Q8L48_10965 [Archangium sp.]|nr:hypothetical protein [Archangium sp.]
MSGAYRPRPSIARYIESSISGVFTTPTQVTLKLDVLSDHQVYAADDGMIRGVFVVTGTPASVGSPVNLDVLLPWGEVLQVQGVVEWVRTVARISLRHRPGMGVHFELLPEQQMLLERAMVLREPIVIPADATR